MHGQGSSVLQALLERLMSASGCMSNQELRSALAQIQLMMGGDTDPAFVDSIIYAARYAPLGPSCIVCESQEKILEICQEAHSAGRTLHQVAYYALLHVLRASDSTFLLRCSQNLRAIWMVLFATRS